MGKCPPLNNSDFLKRRLNLSTVGKQTLRHGERLKRVIETGRDKTGSDDCSTVGR
jgi:hypothetical protein